MRVLVVTKIFPNQSEPLSSPFNRQQIAALAHRCDVDVLATIPWFPGARWVRRWSAAGRVAGVPAHERIGELDVRHPRFLSLPGFGRWLAGPLYAASLLPVIAGWRRPDVLLGTWAYPDGFATVVLGQLLGLPTVVKLHGSDLHVVGHMAGPRRLLQWALPRADRVVAVSDELADAAVALGVPRARIAVVRNGIDKELFHPADRAAARAELGLPPPGVERVVLFVGRLVEAKGVGDLLDAFARIAPRRPEVTLALVGEGALAERARACGARVRVLGARPFAEVARWVAACDVLALPSWNEGLPNVLLEALASARPVVASRVGGIPEIVTSPDAGELVPPRDPAALAEALERVLDRFTGSAVPDEIVAGVGSWEQSAACLEQALRIAIATHAEHASRPRVRARSSSEVPT